MIGLRASCAVLDRRVESALLVAGGADRFKVELLVEFSRKLLIGVEEACCPPNPVVDVLLLFERLPNKLLLLDCRVDSLLLLLFERLPNKLFDVLLLLLFEKLPNKLFDVLLLFERFPNRLLD